MRYRNACFIHHRWKTILLVAAMLGTATVLQAQGEWPRSIVGADGGILYIYQPQADSFSGNILRFKAAFTYVEKGKDLPGYGSFQALTMVDIDKDQRQVFVLVANVLSLRISGPPDSAKTEYLKETIECGIPAASIDIPLDELVSALPLQEDEEGRRFARQYRNDPPRIIVATRPSILALIDGLPKMKRHPVWGVNMIINTPNIIMESEDGWFYLYGARHWYIGPVGTGPYNYTGYIAPDMQRVQEAFRLAMESASEHTDTIREGAGIVEDIIVSAPPAELIQTRGEPVFTRIAGTSLRYVSNTNNDIFLDSALHKYYVLLSGRWFTAAGFNGPWQFVPADALPADFARIPEGSPKDNVLASVAGTDAAREAIVDALLPQTAVISRAEAATSVSYDGPPKFAAIAGTRLHYALNTAAVVLKDQHNYYCVDKGVWFSAGNPSGPWTLCTERPTQVDLIPPDCPVYFCKYAYIFGSDPNYVYAGYTAGYLNAYISGPTLVYGTGWSYPAWSKNACFPRPWTWGFGMSYNPWIGWCLGASLDPEWFGSAVGNNGWSTGWWGSAAYQPPYIWHHFSGHGLYEQDIRRAENITYVNNLYRYRPDRISRPPAAPFYTDTIGDVFTHRDGGWWRHEEGKWQLATDPHQISTLNTIEMHRKRSGMRIRNFLRQRG
ncbi:hypothetical protein Q4E93_02815 [Flavitalea sp. BT771]|uniref:hypothetical protein n=1 Tax=Flavitalea sp. BT771 TaxID=3063329 RepID=UPI0026E218DC|nr:hypothetical protein [Flavitalea sp. BT771]MDO6429504.1 hypothetical protein [Flavitalea sp. BT771]MDV6218368.1 hypothetical protein [Flavitalea sp. BT771]